MLALEGYANHHSYMYICNVCFSHTVTLISCGFCCGGFVCLFITVAYYLALAEAYENGFMLKSFNLGTYNEKSLYKLQVFS